MKALQAEGATPALRILRVDASGRVAGSSSRDLTGRIVDAIAAGGPVSVTTRDVARGVPLVDPAWIDANFTAVDQRNDRQRAALSVSDALVRELVAADVLVIGVPIYNFGVPASLKAWIDMVARAGVTFRYTADGPEGLLEGKKAYLVIASGGVPVDGPMDFATPWMRHALSFLGIDDIEVIGADRQSLIGDAAVDGARQRIDALDFSDVPTRRAAA